jgi:hypothetical protein
VEFDEPVAQVLGPMGADLAVGLGDEREGAEVSHEAAARLYDSSRGVRRSLERGTESNRESADYRQARPRVYDDPESALPGDADYAADHKGTSVGGPVTFEM